MKRFVVIESENGTEINRSDFFDSYAEARAHAREVKLDWADSCVIVRIEEVRE